MVESLKCDGCGQLRVNDTNHWFEGAIDRRGMLYFGLLDTVVSDDLVGMKKSHLCGQACALKWFATKIGEL